MKHVFIIGSRGLPAKYGGFETFVSELVSNQKNENIKYHVANLSQDENQTHFDYASADVFNIKQRNLGAARVIFYDLDAIRYCLKMVKDEQIENPIFYILGNTIGAFIGPVARKIHSVGGKLYVNPDGLEWRRSKWSKPIQMYLKYSEKKMVEKADLIISDNQGIEDYLEGEYHEVTSKVIAYGTDIDDLDTNQEDLDKFFEKNKLSKKNYYLVVGRFVPENNYQSIIENFMKTDSDKDLVIITNCEGSSYFEELKGLTNFDKDLRIKFVGTVYDKKLLKAIRNDCHAYIHGHEVGGTNPGLLEALWSTDLNLVFDVNFNRQVAKNSVLYWDKENLSHLIEFSEKLSQEEIIDKGYQAKSIIKEEYTWDKIVAEYEELFEK